MFVGEIPITFLCPYFGASSSGYYSWLNRTLSKLQEIRISNTEKVLSIFETSRSTYGSPRVHRKLKSDGVSISENTVASIMRENQLNANLKRKMKPKMEYDDNKKTKSPRLFKIEEGAPEQAHSIFAGDITYIPFNGSFLYLSVVIDLFNRKVVGWSLDKNLSSEGVIKALTMAKKQERIIGEIIFHSDQGVQYSSSKFRELLSEYGFTQSMSRRGNCYDNSIVESFFKTLKNELIWREDFSSEQDLRSSLFRYIETWYNRVRLHSSLDYMAPVEYQLLTQKAA